MGARKRTKTRDKQRLKQTGPIT